ncbi:hypothetical protein [Alteromonas australica]|nr:hypothetical protein [Alteromonadaceae bacterium A_SAG4]NKX03526.1 hypothetical protein [Alteromonadaceae bacterium A_SAG6]NKX17767.1 hypothetical protein [Alteromonadaceae bacterium A_SAG5]NKX19117.1 hypothetical protein [Alteromonadaceae bacterium A_SAG8]NKX32878.1 hypothetical protein [Alteromonadaceae bacterium A_SAG3]NKX68341.1 hypothetical protein [Alteromonadaceae bacterium A_SAG7]
MNFLVCSPMINFSLNYKESVIETNAQIKW